MKFPEMRRQKQALSAEETAAVFAEGQFGVLSCVGDDGWPYGVPLNYVYLEDPARIVFHCGRAGRKVEALRQNPRASFCVVGQSQVMPERFTDAYRSAMAFGRLRFAESDAEKRELCRALAMKYCADFEDAIEPEIDRFFRSLEVGVLEIEHSSGKQGSALL